MINCSPRSSAPSRRRTGQRPPGFTLAAEQIDEDNPAGAEHLRAASPHWLRHTGITHWIDAGVSLKDAQSLSRHRSLQDLGTYAHSDRDRLYEQVARLG
ncbi:site-specific tyrosine recombinase XerC [Thiorhodovibrio winogradskyi]|uniref:Site-specific tyrosine recombinase XerC n=1 Tax=Thiorhodovibrio winogradskyi TaxID=77007 RepID=A0ABZ0SDK3_9GAMM|nr:tyrosine-type recombinase/integrase [Thiorhodovibrio winogradskyi]